MQIDYPKSFMAWLTKELESILDADPVAVAKYATALIKKDLPLDELKPAVCNDLNVFLQEDTEPFVTKVFETLQANSYVDDTLEGEDTDEQDVVDNDGQEEEDEGDENTDGPDAVSSRRESKAADSEEDLSDDDRDHKRTARRSRSRSRSRSTSRSKGNRRLSPHRRLGYSRGGRRGGDINQRGGRRGLGDVRNRLGGRGRYRNDYPDRRNDKNGVEAPRYRRRSPRRSLSPRRRSRSRSPHRRSLSPRRASHSPVPKRNASPSRDILSELTGSKNIKSVTAASSASDPRPRCRDYDEKGFCLQGDLCQFSHGADAVVMSDVTGLQLTTSATQSVSTGPAPIQAITTTRQVPVRPATGPPVRTPAPAHMAHEPYNPEAPRMWRGPGPPAYNMAPRMDMMGSQPPYPMMGPRGMPPMRPRRGMGPRPPMGYRPRYNEPRPGSQAPGVSGGPKIYDPNRATLEIKNLPAEFNNIAKLNEHFSKFGTVINLQVKYEGQPDTALVTFSSHPEAKSAHQNPEPLFNNRFIKLFWHKPSDSTTSPMVTSQVKGPVKSRLGHGASSLMPAKPAPSQSAIPPVKKARVEPNMNPSTLKLDKSAAQRKSAAATVQPVHPRTRQHAQQNAQRQLQQRTKEARIQALIDEQLQTQKALFVLLEKCKTPKEKADLISRIKQIDTQTAQLRADLNAAKEAAQKKEKAARELLDTEIDLHQKEQAGEDTNDLKHKLDSLHKQVPEPAEALGLRPRGHQGRAAASHRPGFPPAAPPAPSALVVTGFKPEEKDAVINHFKAFGQVSEREFTSGPPTSVVVEYTSSQDARVASIHGARFNNCNLILKWYKPATTVTTPVPSQSVTSSEPSMSSLAATSRATSVDEEEEAVLDREDELLNTEAAADQEALDEALLLGDDEDDDEEKRSW